MDLIEKIENDLEIIITNNQKSIEYCNNILRNLKITVKNLNGVKQIIELLRK